jgi:hypothetical protein
MAIGENMIKVPYASAWQELKRDKRSFSTELSTVSVDNRATRLGQLATCRPNRYPSAPFRLSASAGKSWFPDGAYARDCEW